MSEQDAPAVDEGAKLLSDYDLLSAAFPAEHDAVMGSCAWCGAPRKRNHALCGGHWASLSLRERSEYLALDLYDRARWILARSAGGAALSPPLTLK